MSESLGETGRKREASSKLTRYANVEKIAYTTRARPGPGSGQWRGSGEWRGVQATGKGLRASLRGKGQGEGEVWVGDSSTYGFLLVGDEQIGDHEGHNAQVVHLGSGLGRTGLVESRLSVGCGVGDIALSRPVHLGGPCHKTRDGRK